MLDLSAAEEGCGASPLQRLRDALAELRDGDVLEVRSTVPDQILTVRAWGSRNARVLADETHGREVRLRLTNAGGR